MAPQGVGTAVRGRAIAEAPEEPLQRGGHQLAVLAEERAVRAEEQGGAVKRAAVALDHPGGQKQPGAPRSAAEPCGFRPGHQYRSLEVAAELVASFRRPGSKEDVEVGTLWVATDEALRQHGNA